MPDGAIELPAGRIVTSANPDTLAAMTKEVNREAIKADWAARGFDCQLWTDAPGQRWEDFTHGTDELVIVLEGRMEFEVSGKVIHPEIGEELFIPAGVVHSARNVGHMTARWLFGYRSSANS